MKKNILVFIGLLISCISSAQVKIGGVGVPVSSAMLEIESTTRGILAPRLTLIQRNAIVSPATGLLIYQTDFASGFYYYNGASWVGVAGSAADLILPFSKSQSSPAAPLFLLNNTSATGTEGAIQGLSASTDANATAIRATISSTTPGGFSTALRAINNGTGGLGVGVYGSQNGSGWGVYGVTPTGLGVYGNATGSGYGVYANSSTGTGLQATSNTGIAASFDIFNNANNSNVINASTLGNGNVIEINSSGVGHGVNAVSTSGFGLRGTGNSISGAGLVAYNNAGGEANVGIANSNIAGAVVGRNDGGGYGVRGFIATNNSGTGIGVFGQVGIGGSTGRAGRFENSNMTNTVGNTLEVYTVGNGNIPNNTLGNASSFLVDNSNSVAAAVRGEVKTIFGNFGAAGIFGVSSGTGGVAGLFYASNASGNGNGLLALTDGNGDAIRANAGLNGDGVETNVDGSGNALYAWVPNSSTGRAGRFNIFNPANTSDVITVTTIGNGIGGNFKVDNINGTSAAVKGEVTSQFSNFGTAGVYGHSSGTGGVAGLFYSSNAAGTSHAVVASSEGSGNGVFAVAGNTGDGLEAVAEGVGTSVYGWTPTIGTGRAARFVNFNDANTNPVLTVENHNLGNNLAVFKAGDPATVNVARINGAGRGFFNGGTQVGGADVAEYFDVEGTKLQYEAGDVLIISQSSDRKVEKSSSPYSTLVAGVYATKPGVLLTEKNAEADQFDDMVPMGVIGVIPTKVCLEGGAIKRGDLLVTSSVPGVAMKGDIDKVKPGQIIGKALQEYDNNTIGKIKVLVSIK